MSALTAVEAIVRSFKNQYNREVASGEVDEYWFSHQAGRNSVLLPEVDVEEAIILFHVYGIRTEWDKVGAGRCEYHIDDIDKFVNVLSLA